MRARVVTAIGAVMFTACAAEGPAASDTAVDTTVAAAVSTTVTTSAPATDPPATVAPSSVASSSTAPVTLAPATTPPTTEPGDRTLFSFAEAGDVAAWGTVDDTVMGGVSSSTASWEAGRLVFSGELSLDNNGGFTSVRGPIVAELGDGLAEADAVVVEAVGDGKTYLLQVRTLDDDLYVQRFATSAGSDERHSLPLEGFEPVGRFLDPLPGAPALDPRRVAQLVIYLLDEQEGPFRLAVSRIAAA